jgi:hypothetical protein
MHRLVCAPLLLGLAALATACSAAVDSPTATPAPAAATSVPPALAPTTATVDPAQSPICLAAQMKVSQLQYQAATVPKPTPTATGFSSAFAGVTYAEEVHQLLQTSANLVLGNRECFNATQIINAEAALGG